MTNIFLIKKIYMKKVVLVMSVMISGMLATAQHVEFGLKGGLNISSLQVKNSDYKGKAGVHGGLLAHIHLNKTWALQPEVVYSQEGAKYNGLGNIEHKVNVDYINVPVLLQYMTKSGFRLQTGPQIGFMVNAKDEIKNGATVDVQDNLKSANFSWSFGAGYLSSVGVGVDARFNAGLGNISDINNGSKIHNNVFQLGIFYQFGHK